MNARPASILMATAKVFAGLELVHGAAVGALGFTRARHVQIDAGMVVPQRHVGLGAGAGDAALVIEVAGQQLDRG